MFLKTYLKKKLIKPDGMAQFSDLFLQLKFDMEDAVIQTELSAEYNTLKVGYREKITKQNQKFYKSTFIV